MNMFKESLCPYGSDDNGACLDSSYAKATGNQVSFKNDLITEPYDGSGNKYTYNTYNTYTTDIWRTWGWGNKEKEKVKEKEKDPVDDNSLLFMGLGVAGVGAAVIVVMALRK